MTDHDEIEQIAAGWIARRDREPLSAEEQTALSQWLESSVAHRVSFLRLDAAWAKTRRLDALEPQEAMEHPVAAHQSAAPSTSRMRIFAVAAAVFLMACVAGWHAWQRYSQPIYRTGIGATQTVALADGSKVTLNTNSVIRADVLGTRRAVHLQQGEVLFEVSHDSTRPFTVRSGLVDVEVVGTRFAVHRTDTNVRVLVTEGRVRARLLAAGERDPSATDLGAGDIAVLSENGIELRHVPRVEMEDALSWRTGTLVFRNTPLRQAVAEFNRYTVTPIVIGDSGLADVRVGGSFRTTNVEGFLRLLERAFEIDATSRGNAVVLTRH